MEELRQSTSRLTPIASNFRKLRNRMQSRKFLQRLLFEVAEIQMQDRWHGVSHGFGEYFSEKF